MNVDEIVGSGSLDYCGELGCAPMTLALGMIASDGWVLASDKRLYEHSGTLQTDGRIITNSFVSSTPKIRWVPEVNVVYTFAGDHISALAGEALVEELAKGSRLKSARSTLLNKVGNEFWEKQARQTQQPNLKRDLLVIFTDPLPVEMWTLGIRLSSGAAQHDDKAVIGDTGNGANIFPLLYYSKRPVAELTMLAAHTILMGHKCNESLVEGLDIWTGDAEGRGVQQVAIEQLQRLTSRSERLHQKTRNLVAAA